MMYRITKTLMSSWQYMFSCYEDAQESAKEEFIKTLYREQTPKTTAMADGTAFETECYKAAAGIEREPHPKWESGIQSIADIITGAPVQINVNRPIKVGDMDFLVCGVLDAMKAGVIYDVKFSSKSFGSTDLAGKYFGSPQHPAYLYMVPEAYLFEYLVSDGSDLYREVYDRANTPFVGDMIAEFIQSVKLMGLLDVYKRMWVQK